MFNYHLLEVDHASSNDVHMKHLRFPELPPKGGSKNSTSPFCEPK